MPLYQIFLILLFVAAADWLLLRLWHRRKEELRSFRWQQLDKKWLFLISSLILFVAAQIIMNLDNPLIWNESFAFFLKAMNEQIRLDIDRRENITIAILLLVAGAVFFSFAFKSVVWLEPAASISGFNLTIGKNPRFSIPTLVSAAAGLILFLILIVRMFLLQISLLDPILWLLALAFMGYSIGNREKQFRGNLPSWNISKIDIILLLLLIAGGLLVSSFMLTTHPNMLMGDEGNFFDTARSIAIGKYLPSFFDMGVYSYPVASSYWQGLIMNWFGVGLWSWRFSSVLIAVLAVIPIYLLGLEMFSRRIAILASISFLAAPYFLAFARLGYNNSQSMLPVTLSAWLFYKGWKNHSPFFIYLAGATAGLGFLTYTAARIAFILGLVLLAACILRSIFVRSQRYGLKTYAVLTLVFILGWLISASPHLVYSGTMDPMSFRYKTVESIFFNVDAAKLYFPTSEIYSYSSGWLIEPYHLYFNPGIYGWLFQRGLLRTILSFFMPGLISDHFVTSPLPGPISSVFLLIGLTVSFSRIRERRYTFLLSWFFLVAILLSTLNTFPPRQTHMVPVIPVMALLIAVGINALVETFVGLLKKHHQLFIRPILVSVAGLLVVSAGIYQYFSIIPGIFKPDLDQVMNWAEISNHKDIPFFYITNRAHWENWKPFAVGRFTPDHPFEVISEEDFLKHKVTFPLATESVVIFHPNNRNEIMERLQTDFQFTTPALPITDRRGMIIGGIMIKGDFIWPVQTSPWQEFCSLLISPAGFIAFSLITLAVILFLYAKEKYRKSWPLSPFL